MGGFRKIGENLVRHEGGTIYLRAKVGGKPIRFSLETDDLRLAKLKRDEQLDALRTAAAEQRAVKIRTLGDAVTAYAARCEQPHLKPATVTDYRKRIAYLRETLPLQTHGRTWSQAEAAGWWKKITKRFGALVANKLLADVRGVMRVLIEEGIRTSDPTAKFKNMKVASKPRKLPSREVLQTLVDDVLAQRKRCSEEAANYIAFLAFSGCRPGEAARVEWQHVGKEWLLVAGQLETGTKNWKFRQVPISKPLRKVLERMRPEEAIGPLFKLGTPRFALANACDRLDLPHLRLYDLRHFFTTWAVESGVDIPTIARWLGHQDGGALLMKTYSHVRDQHSLKQVRKLG